MIRPHVGLGSFPFSGVFTPVGRATAQAVVRAFVEAGGRYVETAPAYRTSEMLGEVLSSFDREHLVVATKCVASWGRDGSKVRSGRPEVVRRQCHEELEALGVDYVDILQAHRPPPDVDPAVVAEEMNRLRAEGLVRMTGVCNVDRAQLERFVAGGPIDWVQNRLSLVHRPSDDGLARFCAAKGIRTNPYQVLERGQLLAHQIDAAFRPGDLRRESPEYNGAVAGLVRAWVLDRLAPLATRHGLTREHLVIGWALAQPTVGVAVTGATSVDQVRRNVAAEALPGDVVAEIDKAYAELARLPAITPVVVSLGPERR